MGYTYYGESIVNGRTENMDSLLLCEREMGGKQLLLAVVCDGVGGLERGGYASAIAARELNAWFAGQSDVHGMGLRLRDEVLNINGRIAEDSRREGFKTASTLSALLMIDGAYTVVHIGDSRIYTVAVDGTAEMLTEDDVAESGKLSAAIGYTERPCLFFAEGGAGDKLFMVCSDGLYKRLGEGFGHLTPLPKTDAAMKKAARHLMDEAVARGEQDNITVALVRVARK